ncbi:MAG TPA: site-specific integrase [Nitrososphaeraceae archaeon]
MAGVRSYIEYCDIELSDKQFKKRVKLPKKRYEDVEGIDSDDIINLLVNCNNDRLKVFILVLASSGMRANEALLLRKSDLDFSVSPVKVHLRSKNTKTGQGIDVYISDEAAAKLKEFIETKHNSNPEDPVFRIGKEPKTFNMYKTLHLHFVKLLEKTGLNKKMDDGQRRQIRFHSFRAFVKTTISNQGFEAFSEWLLGHRSSMAMKYYQVKEPVRREMYKKCMKYVTFLDLITVKSIGADFESRLEESRQEIGQLREHDKLRNNLITDLTSRLEIMQEQNNYLMEKVERSNTHIDEQVEHVKKLEKMYLESMAGHVVMEGDWDEKQDKFIQGKHRGKKEKRI